MNKIKYLAGIIYILFFALVLTSNLFSAPLRGMVVKVDGSVIKINMGLDKNMKPNTELYIYRVTEPIAKIKITQVDKYYSLGEIISTETGKQIEAGDIAVFEQIQQYPKTVETPMPQNNNKYSNNNKNNNSSNNVDYTKSSSNFQKNFENAVKNNTRKKFFPIQGGIGNVTEQSPLAQMDKTPLYLMDASDIWTISNWTKNAPAGYSIDPFYYVITVGQIYNRHKQAQTHSGKSNTYGFEVQVTLWNDKLADSYSDYIMYKEAVNDPAKKEAIKQDLIAQKGLNECYVFEVRLRNMAPMPLSVAPFKYHIYLITPEGMRIKTDRYDQTLDGSVPSNSETSGFVYFPKTAVSSNVTSYTGNSSKLKIVIEEIMGSSAEFTW